MKTTTRTSKSPGKSSAQPRNGAKRSSAAKRKPKVQEFGEGNYQATRDYDRAATAFAQSGAVKPAAKAAAPRTRQEAAEMAQAEAEGRARSKGEDPALHLKDFFLDVSKP